MESAANGNEFATSIKTVDIVTTIDRSYFKTGERENVIWLLSDIPNCFLKGMTAICQSFVKHPCKILNVEMRLPFARLSLARDKHVKQDFDKQNAEKKVNRAVSFDSFPSHFINLFDYSHLKSLLRYLQKSEMKMTTRGKNFPFIHAPQGCIINHI